MEITPIHRDVGAAGAIEASFNPVRTAENREVIQAVKAVNASEMLGQDNELTFHRDTHSQRMILRVVNRKTGDVITQLPAEYVLRLAEQLQPKQR